MSYTLTITQFSKMLGNLSAILDKASQDAESRKYDTEVLMQARLAPDQFPLARQLQITCDTAKLGIARLTNQEAPSHADTEKTFAEIKTRIQDVIAYIGKFSEKDFEKSNSIHITQPRWEGQYLTGEEYLNQHMVPNFYFHIATAYSILRHNGVPVGKKDYLGKMPFKK